VHHLHVSDGENAGYKLGRDQSLLIDSAQVRDDGEYLCIAQNNAGIALNRIKLDVLGVRLFLTLWNS